MYVVFCYTQGRSTPPIFSSYAVMSFMTRGLRSTLLVYLAVQTGFHDNHITPTRPPPAFQNLVYHGSSFTTDMNEEGSVICKTIHMPHGEMLEDICQKRQKYDKKCNNDENWLP